MRASAHDARCAAQTRLPCPKTTGRRARLAYLSERSLEARATRVAFAAAAVLVVASLAATLAWTFATLTARPLDGVEGDVLFEAQRIRADLPIFVGPTIGAHEYGAPFARFYVLYPPLWSAALALAPTTVFARVVAVCAWLGLLAYLVVRAPQKRRFQTAAFAAWVAGIYVLALYGGSGRPDAMAIAICGFALDRAARRGRVDVVAGALFALAAWVKPNVVGCAVGAFVVSLRGKREPHGIAGALVMTATVALLLHWRSEGKWLEHLLASTAQPPSGTLWREQLLSRGPFFFVPLAAVAWIGWRARAGIATGALVASSAWCVLSLAKIGSAANYFMEPCIAAIVVLANADLPPLGERKLLGAGVLALVQTAWTGVASIKSATEGIPAAREKHAALDDARASCEGVVLADEPGLELMLNGRIVQTPFQSTHLARRGKFPVAPWIADVAQGSCLVMQDDLLEHDRVDSDHDKFGPELRAALRERFERAKEAGGYRIYRARGKKPEGS